MLAVVLVLGLTLVSLRVSIKLSILLSSAQRFSQTKSFNDKINIKQYSYCDIQEEKCLICNKAYQCHETVLIMPCRHSYHNDCISSWLDRFYICVICRFNLDS